jgi:hypothetical protein
MGALGGAVLVLSHLFLTPGKFIFVPYAAIVVGILIAVRAENLPRFSERFAAGFLAFMLASIALYIEVLVSTPGPGPSLAGHAWRLGVLVIVGAAINVAVARLAEASSSPQIPAH